MGKAESAALKAFITRPVEQFIPKYGRLEVTEPRQCLFIGTTNEAEYLRDETGGRRFWPVTVGAIDTEALARDRDQLFAEALHLYRSGEAWWPSAAFESQHIAPQQDARFETDAWQDAIADFLRLRTSTTVGGIAKECLQLDHGKIGTAEQRRISAILKRLRWVQGTRTGKARLWKPA